MEALYAYGGDAILLGSLLALYLRQLLSKHTCNQGTYSRQNARLTRYIPEEGSAGPGSALQLRYPSDHGTPDSFTGCAYH